MTTLAAALAGAALVMGVLNGTISARSIYPAARAHAEYAAIGWFGVTALFLMVAK